MSRPTISEQQNERLFRHSKRNEWGLAILAWDRDGRRAYQFEDGQLRVFAPAFDSLLKEVDVEADKKAEVIEALSKLLDINDQDAARVRTAASAATTPLAIEDQIAVFSDMYPSGFQDADWKQKVRGVGVKRRTQKHREPAIQQAKDELSADVIERQIAQQQFGSIHSSFVTVLEKTDLVSAAQLKPVKVLPPARHQAFAMAVRNLLHGEAPYATRLTSFIEELVKTGIRPSWQLVTAPAALVHPKDQVCVSPAIFRDQAKWMAPNLDLSNVPNPHAYDRCLAMVRAIEQAIRAEQLTVRDLQDVCDFMKRTLTPSARKRAVALREKRLASGKPKSKSSSAEAA